MENTSIDEQSSINRCLNCGVTSPSCNSIACNKFPFSSLHPKCQEILKHWTTCDDLSNHRLCRKCADILNEYLDNTEPGIPERKLGHQKICINCGTSVLKKRTAKITEEILTAVLEQWPWFNIPQMKQICRKCCQRKSRSIKKEAIKHEDTQNTKCEIEVDLTASDMLTKTNNTNKVIRFKNVVPKTSNKLHKIIKNLDESHFPKLKKALNFDQIMLSKGKRTSSRNQCSISKGCKDLGATIIRRFPKPKRRLLATNFDIHIPINARVCSAHVSFDEFDPSKTKLHNNFSVLQFESFINDIKQGIAVIDFENVEAMPDNICEYWTGLRVAQFVQLYEELNQPKINQTILAAYLIRKITDDSILKLAKLFNINSHTLQKQLKIVETYFQDK